jgi:O-antigen ligase
MHDRSAPQSEKFRGKLSKLRRFFGFREYLFALFLLAGNFKPDPTLNESAIDLTVVTAAGTAACVAWRFFRAKPRPLKTSVLLLSFFALFVPTLLWTDWSGYAVEKASRFFTLTLLATLAPAFLVRTQDELRRFLSGFLLLCAIVVVAAPVMILNEGNTLDRLAVFSATTIGTGRAIGVVTLLATLLWFETPISRTLLAVLLIILPTLLIATGSRGPLFAVPVALILTLVLFRKTIQVSFIRIAIVALLGIIVFRVSLPLVPWESVLRVEAFASGELNTSETEREDFVSQSLQGIAHYPLGLGLGGFASKYGVEADSNAREFPHNILLEAFLEGGWFVGLYFVYLLWRAFRGVYSAALNSNLSFEYQLTLCILVFLLCNDLVSGELNDSKVLLAFVGLGVGLGVGVGGQLHRKA